MTHTNQTAPTHEPSLPLLAAPSATPLLAQLGFAFAPLPDDASRSGALATKEQLQLMRDIEEAEAQLLSATRQQRQNLQAAGVRGTWIPLVARPEDLETRLYAKIWKVTQTSTGASLIALGAEARLRELGVRCPGATSPATLAEVAQILQSFPPTPLVTLSEHEAGHNERLLWDLHDSVQELRDHLGNVGSPDAEALLWSLMSDLSALDQHWDLQLTLAAATPGLCDLPLSTRVFPWPEPEELERLSAARTPLGVSNWLHARHPDAEPRALPGLIAQDLAGGVLKHWTI